MYFPRTPIRSSFTQEGRLGRGLNLLAVLALLLTIVQPASSFSAPIPLPGRRAEPMVSPPVAIPGEEVAQAIPVQERTTAPPRLTAPRRSPASPEAASPELGSRLLPAWMAAPDQDAALGGEILPSWLASAGPSGDMSAPEDGEFRGTLLRPLAAAASCSPSYDLAMSLTVPPDPVSRGNVVGDVYTVTVTNNGSSTTTEVSLRIEPAAGFYYVANSASVTSSSEGSLSYTDPGTGTPGAPSTISLTGASAQTDLAPGETLTFVFRLATNADAESGQLLTVKLLSGSPPDTGSPCQTTQENVQTVRGNLTILKEPALQSGAFGDVITWTVTLKNTGLGMVYDAELTEDIGSGYANLAVTPAPAPVDLDVGASQLYTVTAQVASCTNLTNTVTGAWSIGNEDGTGITGNPVEDNVDLLLTLEDPAVTVDVGPLPDVAYCGPLNESIPVTVTNTGGAARQLVLTLSASGASVALDTSDPSTAANWSQNGNTFTYSGGTPSGTLLAGESVVFYVTASTGDLCAGATVSIGFTPSYGDACLLMDLTGTPDTESKTLPLEAPTLTLTKNAPKVVNAGGSFAYTITVSGDNQQNIGPGGVTITDVVPAELTIDTFSATNSTLVSQNGNTLVWNLPANGTGAYSDTLVVDVTVPANAVCGAGGSLTNQVTASADVCPECDLSASASSTTYIQDTLDGGNSFSKTSSPIELCGPSSAQIVTATLTVNSGVTWTDTIYTDTLGAGQFAAAMTVAPGSVVVKVDGVDRTADVAISLGPPLVVDFSGLASVLGASASNADIVITYQVEAAAGSIVNDASSQTEFLFSQFQLNGPAQACDGGNVGHVGTFTTLKRGDLGVQLTPETLQSCRENNVTLTVDKKTVGTLTDSIVVTFTAEANDIITPTSPVLGGDFSGQSVTVDTGTLPSGRQIVTFTFDSAFDLTNQGTITFPLFRPCGTTAPLDGGVAYQDRCDVPRTGQDQGGATTQSADVTLFTTPDEYTVANDQASWRFYVSNGGNAPATETVVTNTLPVGTTFVTATLSSASASQAVLDSVTIATGMVGSREVVTFTIPGTPGLPAGSRIQFDVEAQVVTCALPDQVDIRLTRSCGSVAGTCQGEDTGVVRLLKAPTSLLSSNNQTANLPLCSTGNVDLVVKNTSAKAEEYDFVITEVLTDATYVTGSATVTVLDKDGQVVTGAITGQPLQNLPFTPTVTTSGSSQTLVWDIADFTSGTVGYDVLAVRQAEEQIRITLQLQTGCSGSAAQALSYGTALDICQVPLTFTENSKSLVVDAPKLQVRKRVKNVTEGDSLRSSTYAGVGDQLVWEVEVTNTGTQSVTNLFVDDTLPSTSNFTVDSVSPTPSTQTSSLLKWHEAGGQTLAPNASMTYLITGTVPTGACSASPIQNQAAAVFGCSTGDVCSTGQVTASSSFSTKPSFTLNAVNSSLPQCTGDGVIEIRFPNSGARANSVVLTYTLPADLKYVGLASGTTPTPDSEPAANATGTLVWTFNQIASESLTNTLRFSVTKAVGAGVCLANDTLNGTASLSYQDSCSTGYSDVTDNGNTLTILRSNISGASQSPATQAIEEGQRYTWTISIPNSGDMPAYNMVVTETLQVGWIGVSGGNGSDGTTPTVSGNVIVWNVGTLNNGDTWTATFVAEATASATNYRTILDVHTECDDGACGQNASVTTYSTPLQTFTKTVDKSSVSVGEAFTYTVQAEFFGTRTYTDVLLTDTLPKLDGNLVYSVTGVALGNSSSTNNWVHGPIGGSVLTVTTDAPAAQQVDGPDMLYITVTGVLSDEPAANNGDVFTNTVNLSYMEDGQSYSFNKSASSTVKEPELKITKSVAPSSGDAGDVVTYTLVVEHLPSSTATAYDLIVTDTLEANLALVAGSVTTSQGSVTTGNNGGDTSIRVDTPSLALGNAITITFRATLKDSVIPDQTIPNTATLIWDSLPGPGGRQGSDTDPASVSTLSPSLAKALESSSATHTAGSTVTVGEAITYELTVTLPEGTNPNVVVTDDLPSGLAYTGGGVTLDTTAFAGAVSAPTVVSGGGSGDDVVLSFGTATVNSDNVSGNNSFRVLLPAVVLDELIIQDGVDRVNSATLTVNGGSVTASNPVTVTVREPDLAITKSVNDATPNFGQTVTFTVQVNHTDSSSLDAFDLVITDTLPTGLSYVSGSASLPAGQVDESGAPTVVFRIPSLPLASSNTSFTFQARVDSSGLSAGDRLTNTVNLEWTSLPGSDANERTGRGGVDDYTDSNNVPVTVSNVDLQVTKDDSRTTVAPGDQLVYTLVIRNLGNVTATGVVVTDTLPAHTSFVSASQSGAETSAGSGVVTWPGFSLNAGAQTTRTLTVQLANPLPDNVNAITNTVTVADDGSQGPDPTPSNNTDQDVDTVTPGLASLGDLVWLDSDADGVQDSGESGVQGVQVVLYNTDHTAIATTTTDANGLYTFTNLAPEIYYLKFTPPSGYKVSPQDSTADDKDSDVDPTSLQTITTTLTTGEHDPTWDMGIYQPVRVGDTVWYDDDRDGLQESGEGGVQGVVVTLYNTATGQPVEVSPGVPMTDTTDTNGLYLFENLPPGDYYVVFDLNTLPNGYKVTRQNAGDDTLDSDANPATGQSDPTGSLAGGEENLTLDMGIHRIQPVLTSTKRDSLAVDADGDGIPSPGDTLEYRVVITNTGLDPAHNLVFRDVPDSNTRLVPGSVTTTDGTVVTGNGSNDSAVRVDISALPVNSQVTITFRVTIDDPLPAKVTEVANQGVAVSDDTPAVLTDDPDTPSPDDPTRTPVTATPKVTANKADSLAVDVNGDGFVNPGDTLEYLVTLKNEGNGLALNVVLTDTLDTNTTLVPGSVQTSQGTVTQGNGGGDRTVVVAVGNLQPGATVTVRYRVTVNDPLPQGVDRLYNQAVCTGDNIPPCSTDDPSTPVVTDPTGTTVGETPILAAYKTDSLYTDQDGNSAASPGDVLLYQVTIANVGTVTATEVTFRDTPDPNTSLVVGSVQLDKPGSVASGNSAGDSQVTVIVDQIPPGGSATLSFRVTIHDPLPESVDRVANQGVVSSTDTLDRVTDDPETPDPNDPTVTELGKPALAISKSATPSPGSTVMPGDVITYQLTIRNSGTVTATGLVITDSVPVGTSYRTNSATPTPASGPDPLVWQVASLAPDQSFTIAFAVQVTGVGQNTTITNTATVQSEDTPPTDSNTVVHPYDPTAVDLLSFTVEAQEQSLRVRWVTGAEVDTWGFHLWRSTDGQRENAQRITPELILAKGTGQGGSYSFLDPQVEPGQTYSYWLEELEVSGRHLEYGPVTGRLAQGEDPAAHQRLFLPIVSNGGNATRQGGD